MAVGSSKGGVGAVAMMEGQQAALAAASSAARQRPHSCRLTLATNAAHSATIFWHAAVTLPNSLTGSDEGLRTLAHVSVLRGM
eukprot:483103-Prymnesium_polylepis.1